MSKAKQIGTRAETAVKNALLAAGYTPLEAHRNVLKGSQDEGDVWLRSTKHGLIIFEVKGGESAKKASHEQTKKWFQEAVTEKGHAQAAYGFLVTQRAGVGYPRAGEWWAYASLKDLVYLQTNGLETYAKNDPTVRLTLNELLEILNG
jgi:hypothetical protein